MWTVVLIAGALFVLIAVTGGGHHIELWQIKADLPEIREYVRVLCALGGLALIVVAVVGYAKLFPSIEKAGEDVDFYVENHLAGSSYEGVLFFAD